MSWLTYLDFFQILPPEFHPNFKGVYYFLDTTVTTKSHNYLYHIFTIMNCMKVRGEDTAVVVCRTYLHRHKVRMTKCSLGRPQNQETDMDVPSDAISPRRCNRIRCLASIAALASIVVLALTLTSSVEQAYASANTTIVVPPPQQETPLSTDETCSGDVYDPVPIEVDVEDVPIVVESTTEEYFVLYVLHDLNAYNTVKMPVSVTLGAEGTTTLVENVSALPADHYRVEKFLVDDPADTDGDCIDDITELEDTAGMNPVNPATAINISIGTVTIPDRETFETIAFMQNTVKFVLFDMYTDRPGVYFMNTGIINDHYTFIDLVGIDWDQDGLLYGRLTYHPELVAPDGSQGVYYYWFDRDYSWSVLGHSYAVLAASMPMLNDNLVLYVPNRTLKYSQYDLPLFINSRIPIVYDEDILPEDDYQLLNPGVGYGRLKVMDPDERPHPRDIVIYETLPNELSRVAGIISIVPQTLLAHVNLRAIQDGIPNAFIRDALNKTEISDLLGNYVHYTVNAPGHVPEYSIHAATIAEVDAYYASFRPVEEQIPQRDLSVTSITPLGQIGFGNWTAFGVKAANVAVLGTLGFPAGTIPDGFAVPFYFYDEFMKANDLYENIEEILDDSDFQTDFETQEDKLKKLRKAIKNAETPEWIIEELTEMHAEFSNGTSLRYRSSTNNEDLPGFNGAGLYDSKTQHPEETEEDGISKSLKQVYASLWNFRAFTEREFHHIDHMAAAMGVLVHPNYSDELANGVAASFDPIYGREGVYYVNSQIGENLVTNPDAFSVPEEIVLRKSGGYRVIATSNQVPQGQLLMSNDQMNQLRDYLTVIHEKFAELYKPEPDEEFAMEIEFKITSDNVLAIKQARPWIFNTIVPDTTAPTLASIERISPVTENTASQTLMYKVTFSEHVTGVDASDFALSSGSTGGVGDADTDSSSGQFTQTRSPALGIPYNQNVTDTIPVTGSDTATSVSAAVDITHDYIVDLKIDLVAPDGTVRTLHDRSSGAANINQTYTPDFDGVPIAGDWTLRIHDNVSIDDGILNSWTLAVNHGNGTATPVTGISGSGEVYHVTVSALQDGTYNLDLVSAGHGITDAADNPLTDTVPTTGTDETYTVSTATMDTTNPTLESIERYGPASQNTTSQSLIYRVTFSENVTGVDASDFALSSGSTAGEGSANINGSSGQFTQTRPSPLVIPDLQTVSDIITIPDSGTATSVSVSVDITHTWIGDLLVELVAPDGTAITLHDRGGGSADDIVQTYEPDFGGVSITGNWTLRIDDNYGADPGVLNSWTLTVNYGNTTTTTTIAASHIAGISGSGEVYHVTVSALQDGTYNLDLVLPGHGITDAADNPLVDTVPTTGIDETYTVSTVPADSTAPTISSIQRYNPAVENTDSQTLIYEVTFSENVTGVDASDFALSSGSTAGEGSANINGSSGQFTQTRPSPLVIPDLQTVSDIITIPDSGTVTSVSVSVDITHTWIGDLLVELVAPDGTTVITLHNRTGTSADDIVQTYEPDFGGVSITGNWTLRINDNYGADPGVLNSWTLTVNYGNTTTTTTIAASHIAGISGSGEVYHVTVSALQDGTYNLDLVLPGHGITDAADNPLVDTVPTTGIDETYTVSTVPADSTAPTISSIQRYNPAVENTDSQTLIYEVTFSENVTGVDASDFALSSGSTAGEGSANINGSSGQFTHTRPSPLVIPDLQTVSDIITIPDSGTATSVSVSVDITHTWIGDLLVELVASNGTAITLHDRGGGSADDIVQTYEPDFGGVSITGNWTLRINDNYGADPGVLNSWTLTVNYGNTTTTATSHIAGISGSGEVYHVTVSALQDGTYNLDLVLLGHGITDAADNPLTDTVPTTGTDETYTASTATMDTTNPTLESIERYSPASQNTTSQTLIYRATFSENVTGVDASDFALSSGSTAGEGSANINGSSGQFTHTRPSPLVIPDLQTVSDIITIPDSGTATSVSVSVDITHTWIGDLLVDLVAPDGTTVITLHNRTGTSADDIVQTYEPDFGGVSITGNWTLRINDNYGADPGVLNSWTLTVNYGNTTTTATSHIAGISGSGEVYHVTVSALQDGTYNLDLVLPGHGITDAADNPLTDTVPTTGTDETYTVSTVPADSTAPTISSIQRYNPAVENTDSQTLIYEVTFSENVTGVDASDFALSSGSTGGGGGGGNTGSGQSVQTRSPALAISYNQTVTDTISVAGSGTAASISVAVDITHQYIVDLKIDLIAPDGTVQTLHNRESGTVDIDQTYLPDFGSVSIAGDWILRIHDNYSADDGVLNSWTLTINYGSAIASTPVTGVSGSGDTYYVTVSSSTDGTYNLDLIEDSGIKDNAGNPLTNTVATGTDQTYTVIAN